VRANNVNRPSAGSRIIRVGVIGAGLMGLRHGLAYRSLADVQLVGFADSNPEVQQRVSARFGVPCSADWRDLLAAGGLDAVSICLPDNLHLDASLAALDAGVAVLLEKPIAADIEQAETIAAKATGRLLMVGHLLRFDPRYQEARRALADGRLGDLVHLTTRRLSAHGAAARYGKSTSLVWHVAIHDIDLVQWVGGRRIVEVTALGVSRRLADLGHFDSVLVLARLEDDTPCTMECSWVLPRYFGSGLDAAMAIVGTEGRAEVHGLDQGLRIADRNALQFPDTMRWVEHEDGSAGGFLAAEVAHFIRCVRNGTGPAVAVEDAVAAVRVAAAIERSLAEKRTVPVAGA
jgi:UDP-N-acetylglucosamine 3-dehydrogenase